MLKKLIYILQKEFLIDFRKSYGLSTIFLFVLAAVYVISIAFREIDDKTWVVLFWIIVMFTSLTTVLKSFTQESKQRNIYYYTLLDPHTYIFSKLVYNFLYISLICLLTYLGLSLIFAAPPLKNNILGIIILACLGISAAYTFIGSIASKTRNQNSIIAVLGLPIILPVLLKGIELHVSSLSIHPSNPSNFSTLIAVDLIIIALLIFLFPYLWRE